MEKGDGHEEEDFRLDCRHERYPARKWPQLQEPALRIRRPSEKRGPWRLSRPTSPCTPAFSPRHILQRPKLRLGARRANLLHAAATALASPPTSQSPNSQFLQDKHSLSSHASRPLVAASRQCCRTGTDFLISRTSLDSWCRFCFLILVGTAAPIPGLARSDKSRSQMLSMQSGVH